MPSSQPPNDPSATSSRLPVERSLSKGPGHPAQSVRIHRSRTPIASSFNQPEHAAARLPVESSSPESPSHPPEVSDPPIGSPIASAAINPSTTSSHLPVESSHRRFRPPPEVFDPPIKTPLIAAVLHLAPMPLPGHYSRLCGVEHLHCASTMDLLQALIPLVIKPALKSTSVAKTRKKTPLEIQNNDDTETQYLVTEFSRSLHLRGTDYGLSSPIQHIQRIRVTTTHSRSPPAAAPSRYAKSLCGYNRHAPLFMREPRIESDSYSSPNTYYNSKS
jgi:DNA-directed RNA polymerase subunit L